MRYILLACAFALAAMSPRLFASKVEEQASYYQPGTILAVEDHLVRSPQYSGGSNPSDAPLGSTFYAYDISVRVDCGTYVAHFESPIEYLPAAFAPNRTLPVHLSRHDVSFRLPLEGEMKMAIRHRPTSATASCEATRAQR